MVSRVLLAEDDIELIEIYKRDLVSAGFEITAVMDGIDILTELDKCGSEYFSAIVSDSNMGSMDGHAAVRCALEKQLLDLNKTLVFGMSDEESNQDYWRGIVNSGCFYNKGRIDGNRLGIVLHQCLRNFRAGGIWKERMPVFV